jgi:hypothetical protein
MCVLWTFTAYGVLFSPLWLKLVQDWPVISDSAWQQLRLGQIVWCGWLSAISQLASRAGERGGVGQICIHSVTQSYTTWLRWREQGGELHYLPWVAGFCRLESLKRIYRDSHKDTLKTVNILTNPRIYLLKGQQREIVFLLIRSYLCKRSRT